MKEKIRLIINGQEFEAEAGKTILQVARQNDINIPTLFMSFSLREQKRNQDEFQ